MNRFAQFKHYRRAEYLSYIYGMPVEELIEMPERVLELIFDALYYAETRALEGV
jgi:hypothetical protein